MKKILIIGAGLYVGAAIGEIFYSWNHERRAPEGFSVLPGFFWRWFAKAPASTPANVVPLTRTEGLPSGSQNLRA